jgi:hypothetical protein
VRERDGESEIEKVGEREREKKKLRKTEKVGERFKY